MPDVHTLLRLVDSHVSGCFVCRSHTMGMIDGNLAFIAHTLDCTGTSLRPSRDQRIEQNFSSTSVSLGPPRRPVSNKDLEAVGEDRSPRAEITPWTFDNEYHYGDFHGDELAMLRRGHGHRSIGTPTSAFAKLLIRLPHNLPDTASGPVPTSTEDGLVPVPQGQSWGQGGIAFHQSESHEPGDQDEQPDVHEITNRLDPIAEPKFSGRRLAATISLTWRSGVRCRNTTRRKQPKVPVAAGLRQPRGGQRALAGLFGPLADALMIAARVATAGQASVRGSRKWYARLKLQSPSRKRPRMPAKLEWLADCPLRRPEGDMLAEFRKSRAMPKSGRPCNAIEPLPSWKRPPRRRIHQNAVLEGHRKGRSEARQKRLEMTWRLTRHLRLCVRQSGCEAPLTRGPLRGHHCHTQEGTSRRPCGGYKAKPAWPNNRHGN